MSTPTSSEQPPLPTPPRKRQSHQERRSIAEQALMEAARQLISRRGVDLTSVADIGELAGYSRGLVNHRFGSKTALLQQLALTSQKVVEDRLNDHYENKFEAVLRLAHVYLQWVEEEEDFARAFFAMWGAAQPDESILREVFVVLDDIFRKRFADLLVAGQVQRTIRADIDAPAVAVVLVAMARGTGMQYVIAPHRVDLGAVDATMQAFIEQALRPVAS
ncbi:TetR/AcrR family transcriptional regulator [Gordonia terrae]|uniref:TetR/AcrR family transcriptional regulator n=1 Tax=Gordonia terrae TaxID=2055 RepID=UPI003F6D4B3A